MIAGLDGGHAPGPLARAALEAIAWRVADVLVAPRDRAPARCCGSTAGSPATTCCCTSRPTSPACRCSAAPSTRPRPVPPRWRPVGAGIWASTREIAERIPVGEPVAPETDAAWREREHAAWREFVERAAEL